MSSTALKTLAVILVIAAAVLGFVAYQMSQGLTQAPEKAENQPPKPGENQVLAVVAVKRIPPYEPIKAEAVSLVPISVKPAQYYTDTADVVGRTPLRAIPLGSPVTDENFGTANTLAQAIPTGTQAMSLEVSDVIAVGDFVKPGDLVDVLVYIRKSGDQVENTQARVLLKSVRLLAYHEQLINASPGDQNNKDASRTRRQRTAVIAVPDDDTTRVMLGASLGKLRLTLHGARPPQQGPTETASAGQSEGGANVQQVAANGAASQSTPEAIAPSNQPSASQDSGQKSDSNGKKKKDENKDKVITLSELAAIKKKKTHNRAHRRPPRALIEVYQGTKKERISRPY